jgi:hypothetical protein
LNFVQLSHAGLSLKDVGFSLSQGGLKFLVFEFNQKDEAAARAEELSKGGKSPHFIQKVKEEIQLE